MSELKEEDWKLEARAVVKLYRNYDMFVLVLIYKTQRLFAGPSGE